MGEWVAAKPDDLWLRRRIRVKSHALEGVVAGPLTVSKLDCPVRLMGSTRTQYIPLWDLQVRKGRN